MTSTETSTSWSDRLSPRNWSLAWKLVAVGLVPAVLAIVLGVLRVADQAQNASDLGVANRLLEVRGEVAGAANALRVERDRATLFLAERRQGDRGPLQDAVRTSDAAIERVRTGVPAAGDNLDAATRVAFEQAQGGFAQLAVLRGQVDGNGDVPPSDVTGRYSEVVARADVLDRALLRQVTIPDVGGLVDSLTAVTNATEAVALQHTVLGAALRTGSVSPQDRAAANATDNAVVAAYTEYQVALPTTLTPINFITSRANAERDADKTTILAAPAQGPIAVSIARWDDVNQRAQEQIDAAGNEVRTALIGAGQAAEARSSNLAGVNSVLLMLGLLLAATIVVLVARTLTRSLRVLRSSALDVAQRRLPAAVEGMRAGAAPDVTVEPVPLHNRDEVGQVARAFDAVHGQALRLAADQAMLQSNVSSMFVNLSRRSQGLVERQLQLIEQLESNEQDPDQLSNLFQLDHLATRMRRNSENLLVLAGTDFAKRNMAPVPLVDVLRAAVSEIEHYQRITVQAPPPATVVGRATSDIVHLLAELLDNATNFSPPDSQVVMSSTRMADGAILVEIADLGVGMQESELTDANRRLTTPMAVDVSASRRMGLFVVGRLGARHGITVHLGGAPIGGPGGGVTASVTLPAQLVASTGDAGGRPTRADAAPLAPAPPNGVPPQRVGQAGLSGQPGQSGSAPRTPLAVPANGHAPAPMNANNGLPTRTPGSSLRRPSAPLRMDGVDPATTEQPVTAQQEEQAGRERRRPGAGTTALAAGAAGAAGAAAGAALGDDTRRADDDTLDTPPSGQRGGPRNGAERAAAVPGAQRDGAEGPGPDADERSAAGARTPATREAGDTARQAARDGDAQDQTDAAAAAPADARDEPADERSASFAAAGPRAGAGDGADRADREAARADADADTDTDNGTDGSDTRTGVERADAERVDTGRAGFERADTARPDTARADTGRADTGRADTGRAEAERTDTGRADTDADDADEADAAGTVADDDAAAADDAAAVGGATGAGARPAPRPRPTVRPTPNGSYRDRPVPATPYSAADAGAQNGSANGVGHPGVEPDGGPSPTTTPLPVTSGDPQPLAASADLDGDTGADGLFAPRVPATAEPEGLLRSRRPLAEMRRDDAPHITEETTPIFEAIASAWFASKRPVPVDWELGHRPGAENEVERPSLPPSVPAPPAPQPPRPGRPPAGWGAGTPITPPAPGPAAPAPAVPGQAFATEADEGWRAASGAAAERPDELTAAGLPKRRPRARLVPGSAGSAVLAAAPAASARSAESVRGRLASYQQGVRQGRENRLRRDPGAAGTEPAPSGESPATPTGGEHDGDNR